MLALMICNITNLRTDNRIHILFALVLLRVLTLVWVITSLGADISIIFACRLVFISIFAVIVFVICTSVSVRLSTIASLHF